MPNDAKLGLVVGVSLVLVVAVFFFRKEAAGVDPAAATIVKPAPDLTPPPLPMGNGRAVQAKATASPSRDQGSEDRGQESDNLTPDP
ncbi:MAG TPA: hypothetical protein VH682_15230 [Gemmataceae bacterium]|jgi:hypothetical protein